ncbi:MAG TPA: GDSL-type esterase/lipase family protein [Thermoanaerobaculia bacterium]|nr:GDSL-type esterase/lipase family protein [Thermoanaerobaculia bacterium]
MRAFVLYHLYSGQSWFTAGLVFMTIVALEMGDVFSSRERARGVARVTLILLFPIALFSGTPIPLVLAIPLAASTIAWAGFFMAGRHSRVLGAAAVFCVLAALLVELPYHWGRQGSRRGAAEQIVVVGDSLSAGGFGEDAAWPELLGKRTGGGLRNLARPSETTESARDQLSGLRWAATTLVIIEIGGNDMLDGTFPTLFAHNLEKLLAIVVPRAPADERDVVMFELPVVPGAWAYGAHQRRLAKQYGVRLLPKRLLARVLSQEQYVADGLHLTSLGHEELARMVALFLEFEKPATVSSSSQSRRWRGPRVAQASRLGYTCYSVMVARHRTLRPIRARN